MVREDKGREHSEHIHSSSLHSALARSRGNIIYAQSLFHFTLWESLATSRSWMESTPIDAVVGARLRYFTLHPRNFLPNFFPLYPSFQSLFPSFSSLFTLHSPSHTDRDSLLTHVTASAPYFPAHASADHPPKSFPARAAQPPPHALLPKPSPSRHDVSSPLVPSSTTQVRRASSGFSIARLH